MINQIKVALLIIIFICTEYICLGNEQTEFVEYMAYSKKDYVTNFIPYKYRLELANDIYTKLMDSNKLIFKLYNLPEWKFMYSAKSIGELITKLKKSYSVKNENFDLRNFAFVENSYLYSAEFILDKNKSLILYIGIDMPITKSKVNIKYFRKHCYKIKKFDILPKIVIK